MVRSYLFTTLSWSKITQHYLVLRVIFTNAPQAPLHDAVLMEEVSFPFPHTYHPYRLAPGFFSFGTNCTHGSIQLPLRYPRLYNDKDSLSSLTSSRGIEDRAVTEVHLEEGLKRFV